MNFTANNILKAALSLVGYTEQGENLQKFSADFGVKQAQWCGYFVDYIIKHNGGKEPKCAYTPLGAEGYRSLHRFMTIGDPKPGDVIFFDFPNDGIFRISHVGFVVTTLTNGNVLCIEGNTSPTEAGDQRNGGCVAVKERTRKTIVGWARPHYESAPVPAAHEILQLWKNKELPKPYKGDLGEGKPAVKAPAKKTTPKGKK